MKNALIALLLALLPLSAFGKPLSPFNRTDFRPLAPLNGGQGKGLSAAFGGMLPDGTPLAAGGCNFPGLPAAQGGAKHYYDDIYLLRDGRWTAVGRLPRAAAYGIGVTVPDGVACIGGEGPADDGTTQAFSQVFVVRKAATGEKSPLTVASLPALADNGQPVALSEAAGCYADGFIYVLGGKNGGKPSLAAYRLAYPGGKTWQRLPDVPGEARLQAVCAVQNGATGPGLYLFGGYCPATEGKRGFIHTEALCLDLKTLAWRRLQAAAGAPAVTAGAAAAPAGYAHILVAGGVDATVFTEAINGNGGADYLDHPAAWYRFDSRIRVYHTVTGTWATLAGHRRTARAGALLVPAGKGDFVLAGGETKPGVRSVDATQIHLSGSRSFGLLNWAVLAAYLAGMLLLGYYFMRRERGADDFFKGGGRIPWWAAGISIYATMLSAITYMAYPAKAYATDWTYYPMLMTILLVSFPVMRYYLPFFRRLDVTSAYEYLERRFNAATRLMASALFIVFMIARMALVLYLPSLALTAVTGIDIYTCIALMGFITIVYCTMGGVEAVVWGDVVQGVILVGGALLATGYLVCGTEGGAAAFLDIAREDGKMRLFSWSLDYRSATFWVVILGGMANNLISYTSDQTVIQRYLTTRDEASARRSILLNGVMSVGVSVVFFLIGAGLYTFYKTHPAALDVTMQKADCIFPFFMMSQLPSGLAGLLIAAIFAATMSTISSNINSVATAFSTDFYKRFRLGATGGEVLRVARASCVVSGIIGTGIALLMATWDILSLLDFFQEILGLLSSGLGGLFLMGIFFPRIGGRAALGGFLAGLAAVLLTKYLTDASFLLYGFIGMSVSLAAGLLLSLLMRREKDIDGLTWATIGHVASQKS